MVGLGALICLAVLAVFAQQLAPYDPLEVRMSSAVQPPSGHP
jgi:ABC-type antimicrobial peptide transport system permease subunit